MDFQKIYNEVKDEFSNIIIEDKSIKERLFSKTKNGKLRLELKSTHIKALPSTEGSKPEAITERYIRKLLNKVGISDDLIVPQVRLKSIQFDDTPLNRYPDFGIFNIGGGKSLLFEIEHLNKDLQKKGDKEGIEQAQNWFHEIIGLEQEYNAIVTNFNEWSFIKYDKKEVTMKAVKKSPAEILEIIRDVAIGQERTYLQEEKGEAITKEFYSKFSNKLNKLLDPDDEDIIITGLNRPSGGSDDQFNQMKITFYRTIFFRMLFIKILLDWKLLKFDPLKEIFENEDPRNYYANLKDLFFKVLNSRDNRIDVLERFRELPYLNGGLFRLSQIEERNPNIGLNSAAIEDIWNLLKRYNFTVTENETIEDNAINPSILGYIFEKSIGDIRKETGIYYTRVKITNYISKNTLEKFLIDKINKKFNELIPWPLKTLREFKMYSIKIKGKIYEYAIKKLTSLKICDPAVGSGAFLVSMGNLIVNIYLFLFRSLNLEDLEYISDEKIPNDKRPFKDLYSLKRYVVQNNLYGVDINPSAIEICELRLWLWIIKPPSKLDTIDIMLEPLPNIEYNIRQGNSLFGYTKGIRKIESLDKKTGEIVKYASLVEWTGKKKESLSQMLLERNKKIKEYYQENNDLKRDQLRFEIKQLTEEYNNNFNNLLLQEYQDKKIIGKEIEIQPEKLGDYDLDSLESMLIRIKKGKKLDLSDDDKNKLRTDDSGNIIKGIIIRKKYILISNRVFEPYEGESFEPQEPQKLYEKITEIINEDLIEELRLKFFISKAQLRDLNPFHCSMEFSDFFTSRGFDIIVGNPPYGNILSDIEKEILGEEISEDIYLNFLYKLSRNEIHFEYAGILTPKSYLLRQKYLELRNTLLENLGIYEITDIGSKQFHGATNEVQIIFFHRDRNYTPLLEIKDLFDTQLRIIYKRYENGALDNEEIQLRPLDNLKICKNLKCKYFDGTSSFYYYTFADICPGCKELDKKDQKEPIELNRIRIKLTNEIYDIIDKIERKADLNFLNSVDFPKMVRGEEDKGLRNIKKILQPNLEGSCSFISARDDFSYYFINEQESFDHEKIPSTILKGDYYEYYIGPKLLIKHNNIVPETIYTEKNVCFTSSIYSLLHKDKDILKYLVALLNSLIIQFYCTFGINNQKDTTINLNQYMIRHLPIIIPENDIIKEVNQNADLIINNLRENGGTLDENIFKNYKKIDEIIFNLYKIELKEIELIISLMKPRIGFIEKIYK